ncbi:MAG: hypothetical protein IT515_08080 [Burkholderiales bacterium]|nr:hypothetical protein [Burkholderiales bacterium]
MGWLEPTEVDPNDFLQTARKWFEMAVRQHARNAPDEAAKWVKRFEAGEAGAIVTIEIVPEQAIRCGFRVGEQVVVFHSTPLAEVRGTAQ